VQPVASLALNGEQLRNAQQQSSSNLWQPDVAAGLLLLCRPDSGKRHVCHVCCIGSTMHLNCGHAQAEHLLPSCGYMFLPQHTSCKQGMTDQTSLALALSKRTTKHGKESTDSCGTASELVCACLCAGAAAAFEVLADAERWQEAVHLEAACLANGCAQQAQLLVSPHACTYVAAILCSSTHFHVHRNIASCCASDAHTE